MRNINLVFLIFILVANSYEEQQYLRDQSFHDILQHRHDRDDKHTHKNDTNQNQHRHNRTEQQSSQLHSEQISEDSKQISQLENSNQKLEQQSSTKLNNDNVEPQKQEEEQENNHSNYHHWTEKQFWINVLLSAFLTCVGAFCSGMGVGLMSIQKIQLQIMSMSQDPQERHIAERILSVVTNHHLFLVTLLLANAIALESLPIVVHTMMPAWAAILFSTLIVLIAAEIIPQAFCTGPKKITIAYYASPIILFMIKFFWILAYPMAKGLDYLLGAHGHQRIQHKDFANFLTGGTQELKNTQKLLLTSILQLRTKRVPQIMIPLSELYMLELKQKITTAKIREINKKEFSYILVYREKKSNVIGVLKTKQFALKYMKSSKKNLSVQDLFVEKQDILCVYQDTNLLEMMMIFQSRNQRYSVVIGKKKKIDPGVQSIMYSKSDMIANNQQGQILGVVFLYKVFQQITEYNEKVASVLNMNQLTEGSKITNKQVQMSEMKRPLLKER